MKRFRLTFQGRKVGGIGPVTTHTTYVDAPDAQSARWLAFATHEHIVGGPDAVQATEENPCKNK